MIRNDSVYIDRSETYEARAPSPALAPMIWQTCPKQRTNFASNTAKSIHATNQSRQITTSNTSTAHLLKKCGLDVRLPRVIARGGLKKRYGIARRLSVAAIMMTSGWYGQMAFLVWWIYHCVTARTRVLAFAKRRGLARQGQKAEGAYRSR